LDGWVAAVKRDGPAELRKALSAFRDWRHEILAFFDFLPTRLSNGFVEGKNNRTKAIMRQAYGYRNVSTCAFVSCWRGRLNGFSPISP